MRSLALACLVSLAACEDAPAMLAPCFDGAPHASCSTAPAVNRIVGENLQPGAIDWWVPYAQWSLHHEIEGYTDQPSYNAGDIVRVSASSTVGHHASWRLLRMGWYGGAGARLVDQGSFEVSAEALPPASSWDVPCTPRWPAAFEIVLDPASVSGVYAIRLDAGANASFITFVVREDDRVADLVVQRSDFTDAMYNNWDGADFKSSWYGTKPQWVSLDRVQRSPAAYLYPYSAGFFTYEVSMVRFLERQGYDATYVSNYDLHSNPHALERGRVFLSVGHDEYWSPEMRDQVEQARDRGMPLAFFGADTCDGILRFRHDDPHQLSVTDDGATRTGWTRRSWRDLPLTPGGQAHDNPGDTLTGTHYGGWCATLDFTCAANPFAKLRKASTPTIQAPTHPVFRHLAQLGDGLGPIMGYEYEVRAQGMSVPANVRRLAELSSVTQLADGPPVMIAYETASGTRVFNAGSMQLNHGLDAWAGCSVFRYLGLPACPCDPSDYDCFDVESRAVQQLTVNVLADMGAARHSPEGPLVDTPACDWNDPGVGCVNAVASQ